MSLISKCHFALKDDLFEMFSGLDFFAQSTILLGQEGDVQHDGVWSS